MAVLTSSRIRLGETEWFCGGRPLWLHLDRGGVAEDEIVGAEPAVGHVGLDAVHDRCAEPKPSVLLVLRVLLDQESAAGRVMLRVDLDDWSVRSPRSVNGSHAEGVVAGSTRRDGRWYTQFADCTRNIARVGPHGDPACTITDPLSRPLYSAVLR